MRFSGSKAFRDSFDILGSRVAPMAIVAAAFTFLPLVLFVVFITSQLPGLSAASGDPSAIMSVLLGAIGPLLMVILVYAVVRTLGSLALCIVAADQKNTSIGDSIGEAARMLLPMIGVLVLLFVAYVVVFGVLGLTVGFSMAGALSGSAAPGAGMGLGIAAMALGLFVLIIWLAVKLSMILPIVALDKERNPVNAISRSWTLTNGSSLKIFLVFLLAAICGAVISFVADSATGGGEVGADGVLTIGLAVNLVISMLVSTALSMYFVALVVAIHRQLAGPSTVEVTDTFS